jgi:hypothetical protein
MVAQLQTRVPIGLSSTFWMTKLNEAYRWISQKGNFIWDLKFPAVQAQLGVAQTVFTLPADCDTGKPMYLAGPTSTTGLTQVVVESLIPFKPWDESLEQQYAEVTAPTGLFSCFTVRSLFSTNPFPPPSILYNYVAQLYPASAAPTVATGDFRFTFAYHSDVQSEFTLGTSIYFPTPNSFDNLLIELAEAEARRIYGLAGWEIIQKRAESAITNLLDSYRSTKNVLSGLVDQQKQVNEKKLMAQERS